MLTILWDNDGVLVDTEGLYFRATQTVLAEVGVELTPEQFKEISLKRGESTFLLAAEQGVPADEIARLRAKRDRIYTEFLRTEPCLDRRGGRNSAGLARPSADGRGHKHASPAL